MTSNGTGGTAPSLAERVRAIREGAREAIAQIRADLTAPTPPQQTRDGEPERRCPSCGDRWCPDEENDCPDPFHQEPRAEECGCLRKPGRWGTHLVKACAEHEHLERRPAPTPPRSPEPEPVCRRCHQPLPERYAIDTEGTLCRPCAGLPTPEPVRTGADIDTAVSLIVAMTHVPKWKARNLAGLIFETVHQEAAAARAEQGPGTPGARLNWLGDEVEKRGLIDGFSSLTTPERELLKAYDAARAEVERLREREAHFAEVLAVADGGHYRNDWDAAIRRVLRERDIAVEAEERAGRLLYAAKVGEPAPAGPITDSWWALIDRMKAAETEAAAARAEALEDAARIVDWAISVGASLQQVAREIRAAARTPTEERPHE